MSLPSGDALPTSRWVSRSAMLVIDQGLNSVTNILTTVLVAREVTLQQFGVFATVQFAVVLGQTLSMGALGDRWLQAAPDERARRYATGIAVYRTAALVAVALGVVLLVAFGPSALIVGLMSIPAIAGLDYIRVVLFAEVRLTVALLMDATFGGLQLICISAWIAGIGFRGAAGAWLAWGAAAYAVFVLFASGVVRAEPYVARADRASIGTTFSIRYAADSLVLDGAALLSLLIVTPRLGVTFNGLFRLTQIPYGPLIVLLQGARSLLIPALRVASRGRGRRLFAIAVGGYATLCGAFTGLTYVASQSGWLRNWIGGVVVPTKYVFLTGLLFLTAGLHLLVFYYYRARHWDSAVTFSRVVLVIALAVSTAAGALTGSATLFLLLTSGTWIAAILAMIGSRWRDNHGAARSGRSLSTPANLG